MAQDSLPGGKSASSAFCQCVINRLMAHSRGGFQRGGFEAWAVFDGRTNNERVACPRSFLRLRSVAFELPPDAVERASPYFPSCFCFIRRTRAEIQAWIAVSSAAVPGPVPHSEYRLSMAVIAYSIRPMNLLGSDSLNADA
jgi:hypothetical protein